MPRVSKQFIEGIPTIYEEKVAQSVRKKQMEKINSESLNLITNINEDMRTHIGDILKAGVEEGKSVAAIASGLLTTGLDKGIFRSARKRCWLIARTELHRARQQAAKSIYEANNIDLVKWITVVDTRRCLICEPKHNNIYHIDELPVWPPQHPRCRCFTDSQVNIYTTDGWKQLRSIKVGDLVLTHKGRFRKVTGLVKIPKQEVEMVSIFVKFPFTKRQSRYENKISITGEHPVLINGAWKEAKDVKERDKIQFLANNCRWCNELIPYFKEFCSQSCQSKWITRNQWDNPEHRKNISKKNSEANYRRYAENPSLRFSITSFDEKSYPNCLESVERLIKNHNGQYSFIEVPVVRVKYWKHPTKKTLYNLDVEEDESFIAKGWVVHNCRVVPAGFDLSIKVKHGKEGKVVETNIAPNPKDYLYVVKLNKSMEEVFEKSDYSSTQVELEKPLARKVLAILKLIDLGDLHHTEEQDDVPHITVRYGLHTNFPAEVIRVLSGSKRVKASISGVDVFKPEGKDYDVLILRVDSPDLNLINNILSKLPNTSTHSFYQPHITVAYLKKDRGDKYRNLVTGLEGESLEFDCVLFSSKDRDKTKIDLLKAETRVKLHQRIKRGKYETVRSYMKTIPQMASELVKDKKITGEKYKVDPKNLVYSGLQSFEPIKNEYMHLWTILDPSSPRHMSTVTSNMLYPTPKKTPSIKFISGGDALGKEYHGYISAYDKNTGKKLGRVDYAYYQGETSIKMIEVDPEYQRLGLGTKLLEKLQSESETPIRVFGNFATEAGESLFKKFKSNLEKARPYIRTKKGNLEHVKGYPSKARLFDLSPQKRIDIALDAGREDVKVVNRIVHEVSVIGGRALIIGGFVRDALLGKSSKDIDVEVYGINPEELSSILSRVGKVDAVGVSFGVLKVSTPEMEEPLDVSIPRRDSKIGEGHKGILAVLDPNMTVEEATRRRDLTINAISYDPITKEIVDPFNGLKDIKDRKLRAIDPQTFIEDPLRVLRVMSFAGRLEMSPDVDLIKLCRTVDLTSLPKERLYGEFEKLFLKSKMPSIGLRLIPALGIDKILPELKSIRGVPQDKRWHPEGGVWPHTLLVVDKAADKRKLFSDKRDKMVLMLSALLHDIGKPETTEEKDGRITSYGHDVAGAEIAKQFLERLTDENDFLERVPMLVGLHMAPTNLYAGKSGDSGVRRLARKVDLPMLVALSMSDKEGRGAPADLKAERWLLSKYKTLKLEHPETLEYKVKGRHLIPLGIEPGPEMGRLLNRIYDAQLEGKFETTEDGLGWARGEGLIKSKPKCTSNKFPATKLTGLIKAGYEKELVIDLIKSRTNLVKIRKSRIEGKLIPYRWNDKVIWAKVLNGGVIVKGNKEEVNYGRSILVKSDIAKVTGIGKHGVTARTEANKKYQVLYKDLKFWVS